MNKVLLTGNLGRDPEMKFTPNGSPVTNFSIAVNENWTDSEGVKQERVTWFRISAWGRQAETCNEYLQKGSKVLVEGRLNPDENGNPRVFERNDGTTGASYEVVARYVEFLGRSNGNGYQPQDEDVPPEVANESEIPF